MSVTHVSFSRNDRSSPSVWLISFPRERKNICCLGWTRKRVQISRQVRARLCSWCLHAELPGDAARGERPLRPRAAPARAAPPGLGQGLLPELTHGTHWADETIIRPQNIGWKIRPSATDLAPSSHPPYVRAQLITGRRRVRTLLSGLGERARRWQPLLSQ